jgi:Na+/proline symporter
VLVVFVLGAIWAPIIGRFPSLFIYLQNVQAYMMMPFAGIFFLGVLWKRATAAGVLACTAAVCVVAPLLMLNGQKHFLPFMEHPLLRPWLHSAMVAFAVCMLVLVAVSLLTKPTEKAKLARTTIYGQAKAEMQADASSGVDRVGALRDYRLWLSALLAGTTVLWWWMR